MVKRIYLDSNVFISLINREVGFGLRGLFAEAEEFFLRVAKQKCVLVLSGLFFDEVGNRSFYEKDFVLETLSKFNVCVECVDFENKVSYFFVSKLGVHYPDSLHVAFAIKSNCDCIVTFNLKDFSPAKELIKIFSPSEYC